MRTSFFSHKGKLIALVVALSLCVTALSLFFVWLSRDIAQLKEEFRGAVASLTKQNTDTNALIDALARGNDELSQALSAEREKLSQAEVARTEALAQQEALSSQVAELSSAVEEGKEDIGEVIQAWSSRVGKLSCSFQIAGRGATGRGSAVASIRDKSPVFITNRHIITADDTAQPSACSVLLPQSGQTFGIDEAKATVLKGKDIGYLPVEGNSLPQVLRSAAPMCTRTPAIGERVVILGYPRVGATEGITATDGIISGIEDDYYVTNAKIEQGNSGGAAILVKDNCLLGIPTLVVVGQVESFARILPL